MKRIFILLAFIGFSINVFSQKASRIADKAYNYYLAKNYVEAEANFSKLISKSPQCDSAYYYRGICLFNLKNNQAAIIDLTTAIKINPNYVAAYYFRGQIHSRLGNSDEALQDFTKTILIDPTIVNAYFSMGLENNKLKFYKEAKDNFTKVIETAPKPEYAYKNRAFSNYMLGNYTEALSDLNKAQELGYKPDSWFLKIRGHLKSELRQYVSAIEDYNQSILLGGDDYLQAYKGRANANFNIGEYRKAIEDYTRTIELDPKDATLYHLRANVAYNFGLEALINPSKIESSYRNASDYFQESIDDYNHAIKLDPNNAMLYYLRGKSFEMKNNFEKATENYEKANSVNPKYKLGDAKKSASKLVLGTPTLNDESKDRKLKPGEKAGITVKLTNQGEGSAYNIRVYVAMTGNATGISYKTVGFWGDLDSKQEKTIIIPLTVEKTLTKGSVLFSVSAGDVANNNTETLELTVETTN